MLSFLDKSYIFRYEEVFVRTFFQDIKNLLKFSQILLKKAEYFDFPKVSHSDCMNLIWNPQTSQISFLQKPVVPLKFLGGITYSTLAPRLLQYYIMEAVMYDEYT